MIYLVGLAALLIAIGFYFRLREKSLLQTLVDVLATAVIGWIAGLLIGAGARVGMWSIPFFNGVESRFTVDGTLQVVLVFSLIGIGLALDYELLLRRLFRNRGLLFGILVSLIAGYPLTESALQQINFQPSVAPLIFFAALFVGLMFIPFAVCLEFMLARWHKFRGTSPVAVKI